MKIELHEIPVREVAEGYVDSAENGVRGYGGRQKGVCPKCGKSFALEAMQADHITPWAKGGRTVAENCQMLCAECNRRKSDV